ncbi:Ca(2+)-dependent cysteine protease [Allomyces arbusculus]|nr:Ca(2+)-dependent cysteine protease [Allomyces arbusculus]
MSFFRGLTDKLKDKVGDVIADIVDEKRGHGQEGGGDGDSSSLTPTDQLKSNCTGRKKALFVGINYKGTKAELRGCINDVHNISSYLFGNWGFSRQNSVILTDDQSDPNALPTKNNILAAMQWLVRDAQPNDSLLFHYSGHGSKQKDEDGDEEDGHDETIVPLDYEKAGQITDDTLHDVLVKNLPAGVRLTCIMDCCHSGTIIDLPFVYTVKGNIEMTLSKRHTGEAIDLLKQAGVAYSSGNKMQALMSAAAGMKLLFKPPPPQQSEIAEKNQREKASAADIISFSGCRDDQTSADAQISGQYTGALSHALIQTLSQGNGHDLTFTQLLESVRDILKNGYSQIPQMSSGRLVDLNSRFCL